MNFKHGKSPRELEIEYLWTQLEIAEEEVRQLQRQIIMLENTTDKEHEYDTVAK